MSDIFDEENGFDCVESSPVSVIQESRMIIVMKVVYADDIEDKVCNCVTDRTHQHINIKVLPQGGFIAKILTHGGYGEPTVQTVHCPNRLCLEPLTDDQKNVPQVRDAISKLPLPVMRELPKYKFDNILAYNYLWESGLQEYNRAKKAVAENESSATIMNFASAADNKNSTTNIISFFDDSEIEVYYDGTANPPCSGFCYYFFGENRLQYLVCCKAIEYVNEKFYPIADLNELVRLKYTNAEKIGVTSVPWRSFDWKANLAYVLRTEGSLSNSRTSVTSSDPFSFTAKAFSFGVDYGETDKILDSAESGEPWEGTTYGSARGYMERYLINPVLNDSIPLAETNAKKKFFMYKKWYDTYENKNEYPSFKEWIKEQ